MQCSKRPKSFLKTVLFLRNKSVKYLSKMLLLQLLDHWNRRKLYHASWCSSHIAFKHHNFWCQKASFVRETKRLFLCSYCSSAAAFPLQLLFFNASKFWISVISAYEGCVWFHMFTWDYWTDDNNPCVMPQIALLAVSKFQMYTLHI